jgi:hypothetical protein
MLKDRIIRCAECGAEFAHTQQGRGRPPKYCSNDCQRVAANAKSLAAYYDNLEERRARQVEWSKSATCVDCGEPCQPSKPKGDWTPPEQTRCRACHHARIHRPPGHCIDCQRECDPDAKRCLECHLANVTLGRPVDKRRREAAKRKQRIDAALGLTRRQQTLLLGRWKAAGQQCNYCPSLCETVDHVMPLSRGGTSELANLVPCCNACNISKGTKLLSEWENRCGTKGFARRAIGAKGSTAAYAK